MDNLVNPKKRGFLLPSGMKDLIDLLRRKLGASAPHAIAPPLGLAGGHDETIMIPLCDVGAVVALFLRAGRETRLLSIRSPQIPLELGLERDSAGACTATVVFPDEPEWEARVREVFEGQGLHQPPTSSFIPNPMFPDAQIQTVWDVVPLPDRQDPLVALIQRMFEMVCHLRHDAVIECLRVEVEDPGS